MHEFKVISKLRTKSIDKFLLHKITLDQKLEGTVYQLIISYKRTDNFFSRWFYDLQWSFKTVELFDGNNQVRLKFCPKQIFIQSGDQIEFNLC